MNKGLAAAMILAAGLVIGSPAFAGGAKEAQPSGSQPSQPVQLQEWDYFAPGTNALDWAADEWNKANPSVQITHRYIPFADLKPEVIKAISAGAVPDIFMVDNPDNSSFAAMGALADITSQVTAWGGKDKYQYFDGPWNSTVYNGRNYGIPQNSNTIVLFWNKDLFAQAGLDPNSPPQTWADLRRDAETITEKVPNVKGLGFSAVKSEEGTFQVLPFIQMAGGDIEHLDSPGSIAGLSFLTDLFKNGWVPQSVLNSGQSQVMALFTSGDIGMTIDGPWDLSSLSGVKFKWGVALLPPMDQGGKRSSALGGENFSIMKGSKNVDQAWNFIAWTQRPEIVEQLYVRGHRLPSREDVIQRYPDQWNKDPIIAVFLDQLKYAEARGPNPNWPQISDQVQIAIQRALTGDATPTQALQDAAKNVAQYFQ